MNKRYYKLYLWFCFTSCILIFSGCVIEPPKPVEMVPAKESAAEALSVLKSRSQKAVPLLARGRCIFEYYDPDAKKRKKEQLDVIILMKPPFEIYLQGDATFARKPIILGSNEHEFWLLMKPKEISTYWWGTWSGRESCEGLIINPKTLFEALGFLEIGAEESWSLMNKGAFDILTKEKMGVIIKRIHINRGDYLISKIEYYDTKGRAIALAELNDYKEVSEGFFIPASIKIVTYKQEGGAEPLGITLNLKTIKPKEFTKSQLKVFVRPPPQGFDHILRKEGETWIEQSQ
jgi:hypothetical protein